jgi:hypothetical protein
MLERYKDYSEVPQLLRHHTVNKLVLWGVFVLPPLLWLACWVCLRSDIYTDEVDEDGFLVTLSPATKWAAALVLVIHVPLCLAILINRIHSP